MEHSDVFISYRRKDVEFAKKLDQALKATGREVWVDWEDIPPGVEGFSDEIQRGIEAANALVAILSPNYIESEYCLMELREALKLKKRVVPIVLQKFEPAPPPEGIGHINWVYFTPHAGQENNFDEAFKKVIDALEADYDHSREHTRLLLRAIEWDKHQKHSSYVLKGTEIEKAESWQVASTSKNPSPTPLQGEYILTSRKIQRRQQQRFMGAIGVLLVLAAIAAVIAIFQAVEANRQTQIALAAEAQAQLNADIARSSALASAALQPGNEALAMSLALEAVRSENAPKQAFQALEEIAYQPGALRYVRHDMPFGFSRFPGLHPDGRYVFASNRLYDLASNEEPVTFTDVPGYIFASLYLPDGKSIIISGDDDGFLDPSANPVYMGLYDVETGALIRRYDTKIGVANIQLSADAKTIVSYLPGDMGIGRAVWWDVESGEKLREFDNITEPAAFSADLKMIATIEYITDDEGRTSFELIVRETEDNDVLWQRALDRPARNLTFSPDGTELSTVTEFVNSYSTADGSPIRTLSGHEMPIVSIRYSASGKQIVTAADDGKVIVWDLDRGTIKARLSAHTSSLSFADFVRGGDSVISLDMSGTIIEWDVKPGNLMRSFSLNGPFFMDAMLSTDGQSLLATNNCTVVTWNVSSGEISGEFKLPDADFCSTLLFPNPATGEARLLHIDTMSENRDDHHVDLIDLATGKTLQTWPVPGLNFLTRVLPLPDGNRIIVKYEIMPDAEEASVIPHLELWDISSGKVLQTYEIHDYAELALSPDGTRLLVGEAYSQGLDENGIPIGETIERLVMHNVETGEILYDLKERPSGLWFTPDGQQFLMLKSIEDTFQFDLLVRDAATGEIVRKFPNHIEQVPTIRFLPDGQSFFISLSMSGGGGGGLSPSGITTAISFVAIPIDLAQWDMQTGEVIRTYPVASGTPMLRPDGQSFVSLHYDTMFPYLNVWRIDTHETLIDFVCTDRYVPNFTQAQREIFLITQETNLCATRNTQ